MNRPVLYITALFTALTIPSLSLAAASNGGTGDGKDTASQQVTGSTRKHSDTLSGVREQTPENANQGIDRARDKSLQGFEQSTSALDREPQSGSAGMQDGMNMPSSGAMTPGSRGKGPAR